MLILGVAVLAGVGLLGEAREHQRRADAAWAREAVALAVVSSGDVVGTRGEAGALRAAAQEVWAADGVAGQAFRAWTAPAGDRAALLVSVQGRPPACAVPHGAGRIVYTAAGERMSPATADGPHAVDCAALG
ncbi:hypothetical protein DVS28_b0010 (plasmid) [Euzebya pacifica]|uniref:Uncharacterized protein n=1 Tax=Euzebya pacifica TaxID=1608957 RepID=A0A346Y5N3_9ACTN|nr:hypothetical protein DVS28_b0010 [Euzebya pacifica]